MVILREGNGWLKLIPGLVSENERRRVLQDE